MAKYLDYDGLSYLWGKIKTTFALVSHTHTKSQITDFPSSMTPTSHSHGNISNDGKITNVGGITGNVWRFIMADAAGSLYRAGVPFSSDSEDAKKVLKQSGTFEELEATDIWYDTNVTVDEALTGKASNTHIHGNIQNDGTLQTTDVTIANGDKLVIADSSDSSKVARASISFDGSTTTQALSKKGTFVNIINSHQTISQDGVTGATAKHYAKASLASASATAFTATINSGTISALSAGLRVIIDFNDVNSSYIDRTDAPKLNLNSLGEKDIYRNGSASLMFSSFKNKVCEFVYDGTRWNLIQDTYVSSDTKNTAGATDTSSKIFLIGATSQGTNPQTYSQDTAYVGTDGHLYSDSKQVVNLSDSQALTNKTYNGYTLAAASEKGVDTSIASGSTSANLPTTAAVRTYVDNTVSTAVAGGVAFQGVAPTSFAPTNYTAGWYWIVGTAGTYAGETCEVGDMIFCKTAGTTYSASNFVVVQANMTTMTTSEIDAAIAAA